MSWDQYSPDEAPGITAHMDQNRAGSTEALNKASAYCLIAITEEDCECGNPECSNGGLALNVHMIANLSQSSRQKADMTYLLILKGLKDAYASMRASGLPSESVDNDDSEA